MEWNPCVSEMIDQGNCYRCGKTLGDFCPVLLGAGRDDGPVEQKKLCTECYLAVFDSIKPLEGVR